MKILDKLNRRIAQTRSFLCVGLDSELSRLPERFQKESVPQFAFNRHIIEQTIEYAAAYKINSAFYEAHGAAGWQAMQDTMDFLRKTAPDVFTIIDAKRADIGNTSAQYATAFFDQMGADSVTLHPYLGGEALRPFLSRADKASIILCRTSNVGSGELQNLIVEEDGERLPMWHRVARQVARHWNAHHNCMLVVGATTSEVLRDIREEVGDMPLLVPGVGAQGGDLDEVLRYGLDQNGYGLLINASRSIIFSTFPKEEAQKLQKTMRAYMRI